MSIKNKDSDIPKVIEITQRLNCASNGSLMQVQNDLTLNG